MDLCRHILCLIVADRLEGKYARFAAIIRILSYGDGVLRARKHQVIFEFRWSIAQPFTGVKVQWRQRLTCIDFDSPLIISEVSESEVLDVVARPNLGEVGGGAFDRLNELLGAVSADVAFIANILTVLAANAGGIV